MNETMVEIEYLFPNPYQPRHAEDLQTVQDIAASILNQATDDFDGLMQPPTVRKNGKGYELAFGHTRRAAFQLLADQGHERYRFMRVFVRDLSDLQMFEMAVTENIKRKDLNPIEQAEAMARYMKDFGKTSVEAAEFFNVSPEQVRGKVRLLNLPETVQEKIVSGDVNENNARRLLTLQRVAPEQVESVAKKLTKNVDPDRVISEALTDGGNSVQMWQRWQSGEPQAGSHLWTLRMTAEKFPNDQLPELRAAEVAKSLGMEFNADVRSKIEDYIASVLRSPTFVSEFVERYPAEAVLMERIHHLLFPPSCTTCPMYAKVDGSHFCTLKLCHSRKSKAWDADTLARACRKLGVQMYDPKVDGAYITLSRYQDKHAELVEAKDANIRMKKGNNWNGNFEGVPEGFYLVLVGEMAKKQKAADQKKNEKENRSQAERELFWALQRARRKAMKEFLWNVIAPSFANLLETLSQPAFLEKLADEFCDNYPVQEPGEKAPKAEKLTFYRHAIAYELLERLSPIYDLEDEPKSIVKLVKHVQGIAGSFGVKMPKNILELAAEADKAVKVEEKQ